MAEQEFAMVLDLERGPSGDSSNTGKLAVAAARVFAFARWVSYQIENGKIHRTRSVGVSLAWDRLSGLDSRNVTDRQGSVGYR